MAKNLRALTDDELKYVNENYIFELLDFSEGYNDIYNYVSEKLDDESKKELREIVDKYIAKQDKYIIVTTKNYNGRKVVHNVNESFLINTSMRKISFSLEAIQYWINNFKDKYTLIEVQNAISILTVTYQPVNLEEIRKMLERKSSKIVVI